MNIFKKLNSHLDKELTTSQFSYSQIKKLFVPLLLDQIFILVIMILSVSMISSSGEEAMAAVNLVNSLAFLVMALFSSLSTGGTIIVARAKGSGDPFRLRRAAGNTVLLTVLVAIVSTLILVVFSSDIVNFLFKGADPVVIEYAISYLQLYGFSFIPFGLYNACIAIMRGFGDSKSCLIMTIAINLMHLIGSFIFINMLDWGVEGSALSYIVARVFGGVCAVIWLFILKRDHIGVFFSDIFKPSWNMIKEILKLGIPFATEQIFFQGGVLLTQTFIATLPTTQLAAHGIANSIYNFAFASGFALSTMCVTIIGQCIGARNVDLVKYYAKKIIKYGNYLLLITVVIVIPLTPLLLLLYNATDSAIPLIYQLLIIGFIPYPILWTRANIYPATFRAAGDANYTTVVCLIAMWVARVLCGYILAVTCGLGVYGIWITITFELALRAFVFSKRFKSNKWLKVKMDVVD